MLQNGAPVEMIQRLLGHQHLDSTEVYTRVLAEDLKAVVEQKHPGGKNRKRADDMGNVIR
jgi:site-specific recombinase XerD